jgi:hypothetical protein
MILHNWLPPAPYTSLKWGKVELRSIFRYKSMLAFPLSNRAARAWPSAKDVVKNNFPITTILMSAFRAGTAVF